MMSEELLALIEKIETLNADELSYLSVVVDAEMMFRDDEEEEDKNV